MSATTLPKISSLAQKSDLRRQKNLAPAAVQECDAGLVEILSASFFRHSIRSFSISLHILSPLGDQSGTYSEKCDARNDAAVLGAGEHVVCFAGVASFSGRTGAQAAVGNLLSALWWHCCEMLGGIVG